MNKNRFNSNHDDKPLCRFGPGGEFVSDWPAKNVNLPPAMDNPIGKVLALLADMIGTAISPELFTSHNPTDPDTETNGNQQPVEEKTTHAHKDTDNTLSMAGAMPDSTIPGQSMLFPDDRRVGRPAKRKQKHRIRAYRRPAKYRPDYQIDGQGTLFETHQQSHSAA